MGAAQAEFVHLSRFSMELLSQCWLGTCCCDHRYSALSNHCQAVGFRLYLEATASRRHPGFRRASWSFRSDARVEACRGLGVKPQDHQIATFIEEWSESGGGDPRPPQV